jgi:hypothetical protein
MEPKVIDISRHVPGYIRETARNCAMAERAYQRAMENANTIARYEDTSRISDLYAEVIRLRNKLATELKEWGESIIKNMTNDTGQEQENP